MGFDAGNSNLYRYVTNNPTTKTDPSGNSVDAIGLSIFNTIDSAIGFWADKRVAGAEEKLRAFAKKNDTLKKLFNEADEALGKIKIVATPEIRGAYALINNIIAINPLLMNSEDQVVSAILFELCNAASGEKAKSYYKEARAGKLTRGNQRWTILT